MFIFFIINLACVGFFLSISDNKMTILNRCCVTGTTYFTQSMVTAYIESIWILIIYYGYWTTRDKPLTLLITMHVGPMICFSLLSVWSLMLSGYLHVYNVINVIRLFAYTYIYCNFSLGCHQTVWTFKVVKS